MPNKSKPLITVITITYNIISSDRERYFRQCVESVHNQNYGNIEHIIIDGASKDGSLKLFEEYKNKGWLTYYSEPDKGVYDAMNKGIKKAKGEILGFLNSDDFYNDKSAIALSAEAIESSKADYSYADTQGIDHNNGKLVDVWHGNINLIPFGLHYCHQSMFVKTKVLRELKGFDTSYKVSADSDLMIRLVALGKTCVYLPKCIVSYRSGGLSNNYSLECRKDHSTAFYRHIGKDMGLTQAECYSIWGFSLFRENGSGYCLKVGRKLKNKEYKKEYYSRLFKLNTIKYQIKRVLPEWIVKPLSDFRYIIRLKK